VSVYDVNAVTDLFFLLHFFEGLSLDGSSGSFLVEILVIYRRFVDSEKDIKNGVKNDNIFFKLQIRNVCSVFLTEPG